MRLLPFSFSIALFAFLLSAGRLRAEAIVTIDRNADDAGFKFDKVPPPATNDLGATATFTLVTGERDPNGSAATVLSDGKVPTGDDEPGANFFLAGEKGGRLVADLGKLFSISRVGSYSWHAAGRGPQSYKLYGATGDDAGFDARPAGGIDPATVGWDFIADVDTLPAQGDPGGQYGVAITGKGSGALGKYRYLLFDIAKGTPKDVFGNTFFDEIDIVDANGPKLTAVKIPEKILKEFKTAGGKYTFVVDATLAPDLLPWTERELMPAVETWYPRIVKMLPSPGFSPTQKVTLKFRPDLGGTPAYAVGTSVALSIPFFHSQVKGEAKGAVIHELTHVVQAYWGAGQSNPNAVPTPGWVVEGIPDYIRWFLYEPQAKGAEITKGNFAKANYDSSYRITGNFLNWVVTKYDSDLIRKLNDASRHGKYSDALWTQWTGKSLADLNTEWKKANARKLGIKMPE